MDRSVRRGLALIALAAVVLIGLYLMPGQRSAKKHPPNNDPWLLVSYNSGNKYGTYLANGFISTRVMGDGVGSQDGKPLPCFVSGLYDEEKLVPAPTWSDLRFYDGKTQFKIDKGEDYKQVLNMKTGILTTYATWRAGNRSLKGKIDVIVSRAVPNVGLVRATLTPDFSGRINAETGFFCESLQMVKWEDEPRFELKNCRPYMESGVFKTKKSGIMLGVASYFTFNPQDGPPSWGGGTSQKGGEELLLAVKMKSGRKCTILRYAAMATGQNSKSVADNACFALCAALSEDANANGTEFTIAPDSDRRFVNANKAVWAKLWEKDIVIDGPKKDQQAIHSCMFYLLQSVKEGSQWSLPPMGLSDNAFSGHVFWDADVWMFPALILQHPELARSIVDYRYNTLPGAMANAKAEGLAGAQYAWESGYTGKEDTPPGLVYRHERHIDGDVALAQWQYYLATGDVNWLKNRGYPVLKATADYWVSKAKLVPEKGRYEILQVVPPDENRNKVNNSVYTNVIAKMNLEFATRAAKLTGQPVNAKWVEVASKLYIPFDSAGKRYIGFDGYKGEMAKQADTELLIYPLQYKNDEKSITDIYRNIFKFYAPKVDKNGPAMTTSAHAVMAARFGDGDTAYGKFEKSYKPYFRGPFNYFNEKASTYYENMCFLTGAAGPIQSTLFGLLGAKMNYYPANSQPGNLGFLPCLPKAWKSLKVTGIVWNGKTFDVVVKPGNKVSIR